MELNNSEQDDLLALANNGALMGARLINRLLTVARRRKLQPAVLDLNEQVLAMAGRPAAAFHRPSPGSHRLGRSSAGYVSALARDDASTSQGLLRAGR